MKRQRKPRRRKGGLIGAGKRVELPGANRIPPGMCRQPNKRLVITIRLDPFGLQRFKAAMEQVAAAMSILAKSAVENAAKAVEDLRPLMEAQSYWQVGDRTVIEEGPSEVRFEPYKIPKLEQNENDKAIQAAIQAEVERRIIEGTARPAPPSLPEPDEEK